ncbi:hypothetical protein EL324_07385 [Vibrio cholerae]|uniref:Uncharacterized protein n=1 Tax=Vibrio cholerae TaxID=666 RepID=A0A655XTC9_VIBCL|nr:hypothetical protein O3Y_07085 [Vibrio cholerae IEC224]AUR69713.1 hypothetical protein C1H56_06340 [Vibrio cholerae]EEY49036.1 hypothetical protein VIG_001018 [Vibrio cholerae INDRE 91/1]EJH39955.1 hypothetical protein VCCP104619_2472 [Vibrio cholerae CP1046(19)]EJH84262.1 hypothetical protein VCCP10303_1546 [Vibrio cholerae CP1030(3)]EJH86279.1 hypothetical protein VCCP1047_1512 [Vibrio cholerae CP1047(20)]EKG78984.1 hypothetical protein VCCP104417_1550 [Vibrio cholerae CP1044(17)]EMP852
MTLSGLVVELHPELDPSEIRHFPLCDIFTIIYKGTLIGYFDPVHYNLRIDSNEVKQFIDK